MTPVALDAGSVGGDFNSASRFGGGPLAYGVNGAAVNLNGSPLQSTSAGTQNAFGVALGVASTNPTVSMPTWAARRWASATPTSTPVRA